MGGLEATNMTTATATHEPITREQIASEQDLVRQNLARFVNSITDNGNEIAIFMRDVMRGEYPDAKLHHRQQAAIELSAMGGHRPDDMPGAAYRIASVPDDEDKPKPRPKKPKLTMKEIINWDIGRLIRQQTNDCRDLAAALNEFLHPPYVFESANKAERRYQKATRVRPHHQVAAAQEMLKRGAGSRHPDCGFKTSYLEEKMLQSRLSDEIRDITNDCLDIVPFLREVIRNPKIDRWNNIIEDPYTQTHRIWAMKHLIWRGVDIPWEHITPDDIAEYYRELDEKQRQEAERRRAERQAAAQLTPEQEAEILALFEQINRENEQRQAKNAAKAAKRAKKDAKKADAAKTAAHDYNNPANGNNTAAADKGNDKNDDSDAPTGATTPSSTDRGETAVANALARHPEVDLDTALENHHSTAGIPKEDLTHEQIYDAITAEANFQKRQAIIQSRLHPENPANPEDNDPPKSRSP